MSDNERVWRKSSRSPSGNCVEMARMARSSGVFVRDSKNPDGDVLVFPTISMNGFLANVKHGTFNC